jgi:hypothetical protein
MEEPAAVTTPSNINAVCEGLCTVEMGIALPIPATPQFPTAVRAAFPYPEYDGAALNCPFFVNEVVGGPVDFMASSGTQDVVNTIHAYLCVMPVQQGDSLGGVIEYLLRWRDPCLAAFAGAIRLGGMLPYVIESRVIAWDRGEYEYGTGAWQALHFELEITEGLSLDVEP